MTEFAGVAALTENDYYMENAKTIIDNRSFTTKELTRLGFTVTDSLANFVFAKHNHISGEELYQKLKARGVLVRHFKKARISEYVRITIGTLSQMKTLIKCIEAILEETT